MKWAIRLEKGTLMTARIVKASLATIAIASAAVLAGLPIRAAAQGTHPVLQNVIPQAAVETIYAKVQAVDPLTRTVMLTAPDGRTVQVIAAAQVPLEELKPGDKVDVTYYRSVAFMVAKGSSAPKGSTTNLPPEQAQLLGHQTNAQTPDGVNVPMTHVTGMVVQARPADNEVDVVNPTGGGIYTLQASDPSRGALIPSLKIGDVVTAVVSPPIATSIKVDKGLFSRIFD